MFPLTSLNGGGKLSRKNKEESVVSRRRNRTNPVLVSQHGGGGGGVNFITSCMLEAYLFVNQPLDPGYSISNIK